MATVGTMPQIHFLPWAGLDRELVIGPVTVTPWTALRTTLPAKPVKFLDNYFSRYRTNDNQPVSDISVARITPNALDDITDDQRATIRRAVDALTFAATIPNLRTTIITGNNFGIPNGERFQLVTQRLGNHQNFIAVQAGGVLHSWGVNQIHFCQPWEVGSSHFDIDEELLRALGALLDGKHKRFGTRVFRTLEWFRLSQTGSAETSDLEVLARDRKIVPANCIVIDVFGQQVIHAPKSYTRRREDLRASCREIARGWGDA